MFECGPDSPLVAPNLSMLAPNTATYICIYMTQLALYHTLFMFPK